MSLVPRDRAPCLRESRIDAFQEWCGQKSGEKADIPGHERVCRRASPPAPKSAKETLSGPECSPSATVGRKKREFRRLFIIRLSAAAEMRGLRYSRLIHGLKLAKIGLDRKSLSELAIHDPETFDAIIAKVRHEELTSTTRPSTPDRRPRRLAPI